MVAYVNGSYVREEEARISIFDRGLVFGDGVFDTTRTFGGVPFRLGDHLARLGRSLRYIELESDRIVTCVHDAAIEVLRRNRREIATVGDVFVHMIVTRGGLSDSDYAPAAHASPSVIVMLRRIDFAALARLYEEGVNLGVSLLTRPFSGAVDPRVKSLSRLAWVRADLSAVRASRETRPYWPLLFGSDGSIAEAKGANICLRMGRALVRPRADDALEGISLETLEELAKNLGYETREQRLTPYDLLNADETFLTSTSFSVVPVASVDGIRLRRGGSFEELLQAWIKLVAFDFVKQARDIAGRVAPMAHAEDSCLSAPSRP